MNLVYMSHLFGVALCDILFKSAQCSWILNSNISIIAIGLMMVIARKGLAIVVAFILIGFPTQSFSMGFFGLFAKKEEIVVFAGMEGQIRLNGQPAAGANVTLFTKWNSLQGDRVTVKTDANGYFQLDEQTDQYKPSPFAELVITHEIKVDYKKKSYPIWIASARTGYVEGMLGFKPNNLTCELTQEKAYLEREQVQILSTCQWDDHSNSPKSN